MKRAMIIGSPGTGKSTFARKLADKTGLPLIHLDFYYHDKSRHDFDKNKEAWQKKYNGLLKGDHWILDGNYGRTMKERMQIADTIFYFDLPTIVALQGAYARRIKHSKTPRPDMPKDHKETAGPKFFWKVLNYRRRHRNDVLTLLKRNSTKKVVIFTSRKQAEVYLNELR